MKIKRGALVQKPGVQFLGIQRAVKRGLCLCAILVFSCFAGAVGNMINCREANPTDYEEAVAFLKRNPHNLIVLYGAGHNALCLRKQQEGMAYLQRASDGGHPHASYLIGHYYSTDGAFDYSAPLTHSQEHIDAMFYYYERAQQQMESVGSQYPKGMTDDVVFLEGHDRTSAFLFSRVPDLHYLLYARAIGEILGSSEKLEFTDSVDILTQMRDSAEKCLGRPALSVWQEKRAHTYNTMQIKCRAYMEFAEKALPLEEQRISAGRQCPASLSECQQHQDIISQLIDFSNILSSSLNSVSF